MLTGHVELPSYAAVATPPPPPPGTVAVPIGFPTEVPLLPGRYRVEPPPVGGSWALTVTDAGSGSLQRAQQLLRDAGYEVESVLGRDLYVGTRYVVAVAPSGDRQGLDYTVLDIKTIPGLPDLPEFHVPTLIPESATAAG